MVLCRSRALDWLRRQAPAPRHPEPETLAANEAAADPMDLLLAVERAGQLHGALRDLSFLQRQLLSLAYFRGLTQEEIARYLQMPLGSVKTHIRKALAALREKLTSLALPP
jgi:RNA polymerase sigma-70 factor (ECF subfamily)